MTNDEWLNGMNTIEKAKWLCDVSEHCYYCGAKLNPVSDATLFVSPYREHCPFGNDKCMNNPHEFEAWLREEHK